MHQIVYESNPDSLDDYLNMLERTLSQSLQISTMVFYKYLRSDIYNSQHPPTFKFFTKHMKQDIDSLECFVELTANIEIRGIAHQN